MDQDHAPRLIVPYVVETTNRGERVYDIYSRLLRDRIIFIGTPIDDDVANAVVAQLLFLDYEDAERDVYIYINSPGGSVTAGLAIYDTMQFIRPEVATICLGLSGSMATILLAAGAKGKRMVLPNATVHMHPAAISKMGGYQPDIAIQAKELLRGQSLVRQILANHTGQPVEKIAHDFDRDLYMDAQQAVDYGMVDEIGTTARTDAPTAAAQGLRTPAAPGQNGHNGHAGA